MYKAITVSSKVLGTAKIPVDMILIFDFIQLIKVTTFIKNLIIHKNNICTSVIIDMFKNDYLRKYQKFYH